LQSLLIIIVSSDADQPFPKIISACLRMVQQAGEIPLLISSLNDISIQLPTENSILGIFSQRGQPPRAVPADILPAQYPKGEGEDPGVVPGGVGDVQAFTGYCVNSSKLCETL
jgi:hypothetical protein